MVLILLLTFSLTETLPFHEFHEFPFLINKMRDQTYMISMTFPAFTLYDLKAKRRHWPGPQAALCAPQSPLEENKFIPHWTKPASLWAPRGDSGQCKDTPVLGWNEIAAKCKVVRTYNLWECLSTYWITGAQRKQWPGNENTMFQAYVWFVSGQQTMSRVWKKILDHKQRQEVTNQYWPSLRWKAVKI